MSDYINVLPENIEHEHICCAIADKKHQAGVALKKTWLKNRLKEGHVFRKLDEKGKVFIEYTPIESAWVPVIGQDYMYIHCLWVSGKFKGNGHAKALLNSCIEDAKAQNKKGVCVMVGKKKTPFLSDKKFLIHAGFKVVDSANNNYELLALSFDESLALPKFSDTCHTECIQSKVLTIYHTHQCPYISNCVKQVQLYCEKNNIPLKVIAVDTLEKAKKMPCVFNNWAVFYKGKFETIHLLNEGYLIKLLNC